MKCLKLSHSSGFTLLEMLIALAIAMVVLAALAAAFLLQHKTYAVQAQITEMVQSARNALELISRETKMAAYDPSCAGVGCIPYSDEQLEIRADLDGDGQLTGPREKIIYSLDAARYCILRDEGRGAQPFFKNIQQFKVEYLDGSGEVMTIEPPFKVTSYTLDALAETCLPETVWNALKTMANREYTSWEAFKQALQNKIGETNTERHGCLILEYSRIKIQVTQAVIADLQSEDPPESVIQALEKVHDREYQGSAMLAADLEEMMGEDQWTQYGDLILEQATFILTSQIRQIRVTLTARTPKSDPNYDFNQGHRTTTLMVEVAPYNRMP